MAFQFFGIQRVGAHIISSNKFDRYFIEQIDYHITKYEEENNVKVKNIAIYTDEDVAYRYLDNYVSGDINMRILYIDWATLYSIKYYTKRDLIQIPKNNDIYVQYFEGHDWKYISEEQLVFDGDTLHLCIY